MGEGRAWQVGDRVWCDGAMWLRRWVIRDGALWFPDNVTPQQFATGEQIFRTDAEMTAAGAVLVATSAGPVTATEYAVRWHDADPCVTAEPTTSRFPTEQQRAEFIEWLTEQRRWYVVDALGERPVGEWTWVAQ